MLFLENNTTFSGSDIKVYAYRSIADFNSFEDNSGERKRRSTSNVDGTFLSADPFRDISLNDIDEKIDQSLQDVASGKARSTPGTIRVFSANGQDVDMTLADDAAGNEQLNFMLEKDPSLVVDRIPGPVDYSNVQTNKINPNYIDIIKQGSDKRALELSRQYQISKQNLNRNLNFDSSGKAKGVKPIIELGSLYSITYSSFREKVAIRTLGRVSPKGYTRGQRTIAGSMNFAVFQSHELMDFLKYKKDIDGNFIPNDNLVLLDQLPSFNLMMIMTNEYGGASILHLFGVTISTEAQQTSVNDIALMNSVTFYAEDIMTIENVGNIFETSLSMLHPTIIAQKSLKFYKNGSGTTLESLMKANQGENSYIASLIGKSRGLF